MEVFVVVVVYVDSVEQHLTLHGLVEVLQQIHACALTASTRTNERHDLSRRHRERHVLKGLRLQSEKLDFTPLVLTSYLKLTRF